MSPDRWQKIEQLYHEALKHDVTERAAYLLGACAGDGALQQEVESLLAQDAQAESFLEASPLRPSAVAREATSFGEASSQLQQTSLVGEQLGPYHVRSKLGEGGMGDVYRALDTKLRREVALKVLPPSFARDSERLTRFRREAQLLASLNHKNIAAIYGFEESSEANFLVLELVEGETFAERIQRQGRLTIKEALTLAGQVAEGLEAAHRKGITHRDIKPANIKVTPEGEVKVLDFGLAKALAADRMQAKLSALSLVESGPTRDGQILGTPAYMSPEQVRGQDVDKRTDIWAFACVLYESLTGKQAFHGETLTDTVAAVLAQEPHWESLPAETPASIRTLLRRCLQKDANRRLHDIADARIEMEEALAVPTLSVPAIVPRPVRAVWRRAFSFVLTGVVAAAISASIAIWNFGPEPVSRPISRFSVPLPFDRRLLIELACSSSVAISPDGSQVVYATSGADGQLYRRSLDNTEVKPIPGSQGGCSPFFSPDGQWLGFTSAGKLMKVPLSDGSPLTLCEPCGYAGGTWGTDGTIIFANETTSFNLYRISAAGGTPAVLTKPDSANGETAHFWPEFLPDGKTVLFSIHRGDNWDNAQIASLNLESGERRILLTGGTYPKYAATGHLVYHRAGTVMAVPFDADRLQVTGVPVPVLEGVGFRLTNPNFPNGSGVAQFSFSRTGSLVYIEGARTDERTLVWMDRKGAVQRLEAPPRTYAAPTLSPDNTKIAVRIDGQTRHIWVYDIPRGTLTRLTFEGNNQRAYWMPDGKTLAFVSFRGSSRNLFSKLADGSGVEKQLTDDKLFSSAASISPDGKLAFGSLNPTGENDHAVFELQGERKTTVFLKTPFDESSPMISPDGRWVAYVSDESGRYEIYVMAFPGPGGRWQISTQGGSAPVWARNGRELFYSSFDGGSLMVVDITTQPTFKAGTPRVLIKGGFRLVAGGLGPNFDVSADGQRFLMIQNTDANPTQLNVVLNWFEELKRRVRP